MMCLEKEPSHAVERSRDMSPIIIPTEQRLRLSAIPWEGYVAIREGLGERPIRVTYDRGELEIMSPSNRHENRKRVLGRLIEALTEELEIDIYSSGSMTFQRENLLRGLEPDECYWIEQEPSSAGAKTSIRRRIRRRIWRWKLRSAAVHSIACPSTRRCACRKCGSGTAKKLIVNLLTKRGSYRASDRSKAFPFSRSLSSRVSWNRRA